VNNGDSGDRGSKSGDPAVAELLRDIGDLATRASARFIPDPAKVQTFTTALASSRARARDAVERGKQRIAD
jgi:hypothetical protein